MIGILLDNNDPIIEFPVEVPDADVPDLDLSGSELPEVAPPAIEGADL